MQTMGGPGPPRKWADEMQTMGGFNSGPGSGHNIKGVKLTPSARTVSFSRLRPLQVHFMSLPFSIGLCSHSCEFALEDVKGGNTRIDTIVHFILNATKNDQTEL